MKKLARTLTKVAKKLKERYEFLASISIEVCEGYGLADATAYRRLQNGIYVDLKGLRLIYQTPRYNRRFGESKSFEHFALKIILHEIRHVYQDIYTPPNRLISSLLEIRKGDIVSHDESWIEVDADKWARKEYPKVKHLLDEVGL